MLDASLIVVIGYGFRDTHINKMLIQGLHSDNPCYLFVVYKCEMVKQKIREIGDLLKLDNCKKEKVLIHSGSAKQFLADEDIYSILSDKMPKSIDAPFWQD